MKDFLKYAAFAGIGWYLLKDQIAAALNSAAPANSTATATAATAAAAATTAATTAAAAKTTADAAAAAAAANPADANAAATAAAAKLAADKAAADKVKAQADAVAAQVAADANAKYVAQLTANQQRVDQALSLAKAQQDVANVLALLQGRPSGTAAPAIPVTPAAPAAPATASAPAVPLAQILMNATQSYAGAGAAGGYQQTVYQWNYYAQQADAAAGKAPVVYPGPDEYNPPADAATQMTALQYLVWRQSAGVAALSGLGSMRTRTHRAWRIS